MALLCAALISCDKTGGDNPPSGDDPAGIPEEYGEFELAEGAVFMTEDMTSMFSSVEDGKIVLSDAAPAESVPSVGTVIIAPITEKTPAGLLVKVVSVDETASGYTLTTEPVSLAEAFDELHVESALDVSQYIEHALDADGNLIVPEQIPSSIWDEFSKDPEDTTFTIPTKASGSVETTLAGKFPIENDIFEGYLFSDMNLKVSIDISRSKLNRFDIALTKRTGIAGDLLIAGAEAGFTWKIAEIEYRFRPFLIPGTPVVIRPSLYVEEDFKAEGKIEVKASMRYYAENQLYSFSYSGGQPQYRSERLNGDSYLKFKAVSAEAEMELSTTAGGKFEVYDEGLLAFGMELTAAETFKMSNEISMEDDGLLVDNPEVEVIPSLQTSLYCKSLMFGFIPGADEGKLSYIWDFGLPSYKLTALPEFSGIQQNEAGGKLRVSADVEEKSFLECSEKGFALFEEDGDEPLIHLSFSAEGSSAKSSLTLTKAVISEDVVFSLPSSDKSYIALPYVVADDKYYYGEDDRWVDLGLPSGILWAKYNVGATSPEEYGGYYAWGETEEKDSYTEDNYKYCHLLGYDEWGFPYYKWHDIGNSISGSKYDVASKKWSSGARMPTRNEALELITKCTFKSHILEGISGNLVIGPNGNSIFLPFSGVREGNVLDENGYHGYIWTSSIYSSNHAGAYFLGYSSAYGSVDDEAIRSCGLPIRPVKDKDSQEE